MFGSRKPAPEAASHLKDVAFFEGFSDEELARVAQLAEEIEAQEGAELTDQGRPGQDCFVILEGQAGVYVSGEHIATSGPGSMVGEMALIDHRPRSATVVAETPMVLLAFNTKGFKALLDEMPKASQRVMSILNARLQDNASR